MLTVILAKMLFVFNWDISADGTGCLICLFQANEIIWREEHPPLTFRSKAGFARSPLTIELFLVFVYEASRRSWRVRAKP
jgi:hypothetical protein